MAYHELSLINKIMLYIVTMLYALSSGSCRLSCTPETRGANDLEWCYNDIALQTKSPELCYKISPKAVYTAGWSAKGHQISYCRSECFSDVAAVTGDVSLCDKVKPISTPFLDGSFYSKEKCIKRASNRERPGSDGYSCNGELLLKKMGYTEDDIPARFKKNGYVDYIDFYAKTIILGYNIRDFKRRYSLLPDFSNER